MCAARIELLSLFETCNVTNRKGRDGHRDVLGALIKRAMDVAISACGLIVLAPIFLAAAVAVRLDSPGPIIFRQRRIGRNFQPFELLKFRTMVVGAERAGKLTVRNDPRVTRSGWFLRKFKIDEMPQLVNVVTGDMSLVGPRPEVPEYIELFRSDYEMILQIRPGITDFASIEFHDESEQLRRAVDPEKEYVTRILPKKIILAKRYLNESSPLLDLRLILFTLWRILLTR